MSEKKFLTIEEQINYLKNEKRISCDPNDAESLLRIGYFNLVNGYKTPFTSSRDSNGNHIYTKGTTIKQIIELKNFDDNLRHLLLKVITRIEEEIRTITSYLLEKNKAKNRGWRSIKSYNPNIAQADVQKLIQRIKNQCKEREDLEYVSFYKRNHPSLPMWIITKVIFLGTFIDLIEYSKPPVIELLCKTYGIEDNDGNYNEKLLIGGLHWVRIVRNACAHNERIYCLHGEGRIFEKEINKFGKRYKKTKTKSVFDLLIYLRYFMSKNEYAELVSTIKTMLEELEEKVTPYAFNNIRGNMGIKSLEDLDILINDGFDNNYIIIINNNSD